MKNTSHALMLLSILFVAGDPETCQAAAEAPPPVKFSKKEWNGRLAPEFPAFPAYPGARLARSYEKTEEARVGHEALWETTDAVSQVMAWYLEQLPAQGWTIEQPPEDLSASEQFLVARKGSLKVHVILDSENQKTEISVEFPLGGGKP